MSLLSSLSLAIVAVFIMGFIAKMIEALKDVTSKNYQKHTNEYFIITFWVDEDYTIVVTDIIFFNDLKHSLTKSDNRRYIKYVRFPITDVSIKVYGQKFRFESFTTEDDFGGFYYKLYDSCKEEYKRQQEANAFLLNSQDDLLGNIGRNFKQRNKTVWFKKPYNDNDLV